MKLWSRDGALLKTLNGHKDIVRDVSFSPDGQQIATVGWDGAIRLWNLSGQQLVQRMAIPSVPEGIVLTLDLSHAKPQTAENVLKNSPIIVGRLFENSPALRAGLTINDRILAIDGKSTTAMGVEEATNLIRGKVGTKVTLRISRQGSKDFDLTITRVGDVPTVWYSVSFSPDGRTLASISSDGIVQLWKLNGNLLETLKTLKSRSLTALAVSFSPDGQTIASASDMSVKLWNRDGKEIRTIFGQYSIVFNDGGHELLVTSVTVSPDGKMIASASIDKTVRLWSIDGTLLKTLQNHTDSVFGVLSVSFSPDSKMLATSQDKTVKLWSVNGTLLKTFHGHTNTVKEVRFSPDGRTIASASFDGTVKLWSIDGGEPKTLQGFSSTFDSVSFSPDGKIIAAGGLDGVVKLWSHDGTLLKALKGHSEGNIFSVSFSPDGKTIASASQDKTVILWNLDLDDLMVRGCNWVRDYLKTNPNVSESDRPLCDGIGTSR